MTELKPGQGGENSKGGGELTIGQIRDGYIDALGPQLQQLAEKDIGGGFADETELFDSLSDLGQTVLPKREFQPEEVEAIGTGLLAAYGDVKEAVSEQRRMAEEQRRAVEEQRTAALRIKDEYTDQIRRGGLARPGEEPGRPFTERLAEVDLGKAVPIAVGLGAAGGALAWGATQEARIIADGVRHISVSGPSAPDVSLAVGTALRDGVDWYFRGFREGFEWAARIDTDLPSLGHGAFSWFTFIGEEAKVGAVRKTAGRLADGLFKRRGGGE